MSTETIESPQSLEKVLKGQIVGLDLDGVLGNIFVPVLKRLNKDYNANYTVMDFDSWTAIQNLLEENHDVSENEAREYDRNIWTNPDVLIQSPPVEGSQDFVKGLSDSEIIHYVITSREPHLEVSTHLWLEKYFPSIREDQIYINQHNYVDGHQFKYKQIAHLDVALHIDDARNHTDLILNHTNASTFLLLAGNEALVEYETRRRILTGKGAHATLKDVRNSLISHGFPS